MPIGRPSAYSDDVADEICNRVSTGESITAITRDAHMPSRPTIAEWVMRPPKGGEAFPVRFARARELGIDALVDEALDLARDGSRDYIVDEDGKKQVDHEHIARTKLICEQIRWTASKIYRRQYGEDGLFSGLAAQGTGKFSLTIEMVGAPVAVEASGQKTFDVEAEAEAEETGE